MDLEERLQQTEERATDACTREPELNDWGLEAYGDAPGGIGGGVGAFFWFPNQAELLQFVRENLTFVNPGPRSADHTEVARTVEAIAARIVAGEVAMDDAIPMLNDALRGFSQLRWWGTFRDLTHGERAFEQELRAWFRGWDEYEDEPKDVSAIAEKDLETFKDGIREWGI